MTVFSTFSRKDQKERKKKKLYFSTIVVPATTPIDELGPNQCRFPQGDGPFLFCGDPTERGSYCEKCRKIVYK